MQPVLLGKHLALDKNFLRNFSYVRVKIGSLDLSLVPNTRIGEIKGGFYELQYTRELFESSTTPGTPIVVNDKNNMEEEGQGTPKHQRTGRDDNNIGSQSAHTKTTISSQTAQGTERMTAPPGSSNLTKDYGKRIVSETVSIPSHISSLSNGEASTSSVSPADTMNKTILNVVSDVPHVLAPEKLDFEPALTQDDPTFRKFVCDLTKSGSDKAIHLQKQYSHLMDPIIEENPKDNEMSEEKVDYDSSSSDSDNLCQGMGGGGISRMVIMALSLTGT
jgi:hypothetical protein